MHTNSQANNNIHTTRKFLSTQIISMQINNNENLEKLTSPTRYYVDLIELCSIMFSG